MGAVPTVRVNDGHGGFVRINASEYRPDLHELVADEPMPVDDSGELVELLATITGLDELEVVESTERAGRNRAAVLQAVADRRASLTPAGAEEPAPTGADPAASLGVAEAAALFVARAADEVRAEVGAIVDVAFLDAALAVERGHKARTTVLAALEERRRALAGG